MRVARLYASLSPVDVVAQVIGKQVLRSATPASAPYRKATRARSSAEFVSQIGACVQELEETQYWFELLIETRIVSEKRLFALWKEAQELTALLTASIRTSKPMPS